MSVHVQGRFEPVSTKKAGGKKHRGRPLRTPKTCGGVNGSSPCPASFAWPGAEGRIFPDVNGPAFLSVHRRARSLSCAKKLGVSGPELGCPGVSLPLVQALQSLVLDRAGLDRGNVGKLNVQHPSNLGGLTYAGG